jgi:hypothetical protein
MKTPLATLSILLAALFCATSLVSAQADGASLSLVEEGPAAAAPFNGVHSFPNVASLKCETCRYMVSHILNSNINLEAVCGSMRGTTGQDNIPLAASCSAFVASNGEKVVAALSPNAVCARMNQCPSDAPGAAAVPAAAPVETPQESKPE